MDCIVCNKAIEIKQGKRVPYAYCVGCGTRYYFKPQMIAILDDKKRDDLIRVKGSLPDKVKGSVPDEPKKKRDDIIRII